jgi:hypothetical protein
MHFSEQIKVARELNPVNCVCVCVCVWGGGGGGLDSTGIGISVKEGVVS